MTKPMPRLTPILLLFFLSVGALAAQKEKDLDRLKADAAKASGGEQAKLYAEIAERQVDVADGQFTQGNSTQAQATVQEILQNADKSREIAISKGSHRKEVEIILRRTQRHLESVKQTLAADDRPPLDAVEKKLEEFRQELLESMFAPKKKKEEK